MKKYYLLLLLAAAIVGCNTTNDPTIPSGTKPVANFTCTTSGLTVKFKNTSKYAYTYSWDFGDGKTSSNETVSHTYSDPGTYTVTLEATNGTGRSTKTQRISVKNPTEVRVVGFRMDKVGLDGKYWYIKLEDSGPWHVETVFNTTPHRIYKSDTPVQYTFAEPQYLSTISKQKYYTVYAYWSDNSSKGFTQRLEQKIYRDTELYKGYPTEVTKTNNAGDTQVTLLLEWR